jgi:hypothetical protein
LAYWSYTEAHDSIPMRRHHFSILMAVKYQDAFVMFYSISYRYVYLIIATYYSFVNIQTFSSNFYRTFDRHSPHSPHPNYRLFGTVTIRVPFIA